MMHRSHLQHGHAAHVHMHRLSSQALAALRPPPLCRLGLLINHVHPNQPLWHAKDLSAMGWEEYM